MNAFQRALSTTTAVALLLAGAARAQTIVVDTAADDFDFGGLQQVADLPGPDGKVSLVEAGVASDNTPGVQTIAFHVPQIEWTYQWLYPGRAVLNPSGGFRVFDTAIIDGTTQTAFTGDTNPNGGEVVIWSQLFMINNVGGAVRGLDFSQIVVSGGSGNVIQGNSNSAIEISDGADSNLVGGTAPGEGNIGSGHIKLVSTSNNVVVGNTVQLVRVLGNGPFQPPTVNNRIGGPTLAERNKITGRGSMSSQGYPGGMAVEIGGATGTVIENNWIGLSPDGLSQGHPYVTVGIMLWGATNDTTLIRANRIAGIRAFSVHPYPYGTYYGTGIVINSNGSGVTIVGNKIGLNANDQPVLGCVIGISTANDYYGNLQNVVIGGTAPGEGNEIAGNDHEGIVVDNAYSGVRISGNSIHDNGTLGIELINSGFLWGVSPNDPLDIDGGANGLQNFPTLQSAMVAGGATQITGALHSSPLTNFQIEFFASPQCDASGFGEGRLFLGFAPVSTDNNGDASIAAALSAVVAPGWYVSATAIALASGSTSEFSACVQVTGSAFTTYCTAKTNSQGCTPAIAAVGAPSASNASSFTISASNVLNRQNGVFFYGFAQQIAPFQGGFKCMSSPSKRTPVQNSGGSALPAVDCSGIYSFAFNAWIQTGLDPALVVGQEVDGQFWSRDSGSPSTTGLTNAIHFVIGS